MPLADGGGQHGGEIGVLVIYSAGALLVVASRSEPRAHDRRLRKLAGPGRC